ncbi:MAG TPA: hypothetical protein VL860_12730 [Planctomycetota bacterium]|nr:hypothetical protein [Planctomycetota bacterium]
MSTEASAEYLGHIKNGMVIFDQPITLPDGTPVRITLATGETLPTLAERLSDVIGIVPGLPSDLAENHDHYLHGKPKR